MQTVQSIIPDITKRYTYRRSICIRANTLVNAVTSFRFFPFYLILLFVFFLFCFLFHFILATFSLCQNRWPAIGIPYRIGFIQCIVQHSTHIGSRMNTNHSVCFWLWELEAGAGELHYIALCLRVEWSIPSYYFASTYPFRIRTHVCGSTQAHSLGYGHISRTMWYNVIQCRRTIEKKIFVLKRRGWTTEYALQSQWYILS